MALIKCNECGKEISDKSKTCIHCGCPIEEKNICNECGTILNKNDKVCKNCGCPIEIEEEIKKSMAIKIWLIICIFVCFFISIIPFILSAIKIHIELGTNINISVLVIMALMLGVSYIMLLRNLNKNNYFLMLGINTIIFIYNIFFLPTFVAFAYIILVFLNVLITSLVVRNKLKNDKFNIKEYVPIIVGVVAFIVIIFICMNSLDSNNNTKNISQNNTIDFQKIVDNSNWTCVYPYCIVASDGSYLKFDTKPNDNERSDDGATAYFIEDVNEALGFNSSLFAKMESSRGIDGKQTEENDNVKVTWSYVSSKGLEVIYELK